MIIEEIVKLDGYLKPILGSLTILAIIWSGVWLYSLYQSRLQFKEIQRRFDLLEKKLEGKE